MIEQPHLCFSFSPFLEGLPDPQLVAHGIFTFDDIYSFPKKSYRVLYIVLIFFLQLIMDSWTSVFGVVAIAYAVISLWKVYPRFVRWRYGEKVRITL